jgi:hypothetical protein
MSTRWSYSSMSLFQQCPKKYYHLRVAQDAADPPSEQMRYGLEVHKAAEDYVRDGTPIPEKFAYMQEPLDRLKQMKGDTYCEYKMGITRDLKACSFGSKDAWWRGIADLLIINGDKARVVDYKTGKNQYADTKQLELLALATFKHFPQVVSVSAGLLFVVHTAFIKEKFHTDEQEQRWGKWLQQTSQLDEAFETNTWNPKQNFTCRSWCPVTTCSHNGRSV